MTREVFEVAWFMALLLLAAAWQSVDRKPPCRTRAPLIRISTAFAGLTAHAAVGNLGYAYPSRDLATDYIGAGLIASSAATLLALFADGLTRIALLLCGGFVTYLWLFLLVLWITV